MLHIQNPKSMHEEYRAVPNFEDYYEVSNFGNFRSKTCVRTMKNGVERRYVGDQIKPYEGRDGYMMVDMTDKNGYRKPYKLHRLVAEAFLANPLCLPVVNHRNENIKDNRVQNLEWCSIRYNLRYGTAQRRRVQKIAFRVRQYTESGGYLKTFVSIHAASRLLKLPLSGIYNCCIGKIPSYRGYIFRKVEKDATTQSEKS